ncbi:MAG: response regulator [Gammaproteobacteria bacterium]|nr:response regulator [Gammaproteobacteria bacterium]NNJ51039.1 response regulator [Gammaproteobacteria bacterium]
MFDWLTRLYNDAHLQNLRADFHELDEHIASRRETVRIISRFPHIKQLLSGQDGAEPEVVQGRYIDWMNRLVSDRLDVVQVLFVDRDGNQRLLMQSDLNTLEMHIEKNHEVDLDQSFFEEGISALRGQVITSNINIDERAGRVDPTRYMNLQLITPVFEQEVLRSSVTTSAPPIGAVVINLDIGGLARVFQGLLWVHDDGRYLTAVGSDEAASTAFADFPGLDGLFKAGNLNLWKGEDGRQAIWVPLFATTDSGPLWVGRFVDSSPLDSFRQNLELRTVGILFAMVVLVFFVAHRFADRAEKIQASLTDGVARMLEEDKPVTFDWTGPREVRALGDKLTTLSETHAKNRGDLRDYAAELERTNRYKSEFLANVSHELRTPLNSILLLSKLLVSEDQGLDDKHKQQARVINKAGQDLLQLINDILDLSKIEAGRLDLHLREVTIADLLNDIHDLFKPVADEKGLVLVVERQPSAPETLLTDADKLAQILRNFMGNAIKFTAQGQITLRLEHDVSDSQWPVRISVTDTGIGIPEEKHELIFEAFQQADGSTSRRYGGTGLGLSISCNLADLLGGRITVDSQSGQGATFTLMLPERLESSDQSDKPILKEYADSEAEGSEAIPIANFNGARILLVDDDMRNLLALTPVLEGWGLDVIAAGDGEEALETLAEESDVAVALIDVMLPGLDGLGLAGAIREQSRFATLPCIGLSAKAGDDDRERWLALGVGDYLVKPVDVHELHSVLSKALNVETGNEETGKT